MSETGFGPDLELIRALARVLEETGLGEIEYAEGDRRIRVARGGAVTFAAPAASGPAPVPPAGDAEPEALGPGVVTSPMVGTAYVAPEPGAPPFVRPGDRVREGQTLLIIEAMKVMNPIKAPRAGIVGRVFVTDGAPVEYGAPLLSID